jgi:hypothetical protein
VTRRAPRQEAFEDRSMDYWIEMCKRAYADGEERALAYLPVLVQMQQVQHKPRMDWLDHPQWFRDLYRQRYAIYGTNPVPVKERAS